MISKLAKAGLVTTICLIGVHLQAQMVTPINIRGSNVTLTHIGTSSKTQSLTEALVKSSQPWEKSVFIQKPRQESLKALYESAIENTKSPKSKTLGGMDGGGGKALVCQEPGGEYKIKLLDVQDAENLNVELDLGPGKTFMEKIDYVLNRFAKVSPARAAVYRAMILDLFTSETQWVQNTVMPPIDDTKLALIPKNCYPIQIAIQRPLDQAHIPNTKPYIIDKDVFPLFDEDSKALLGLHEVLYREARYSGKDDSVFTRHLVGVIASRQIEKMTLEQYNLMLVKNKVDCVEAPSLLGLISYGFITLNSIDNSSCGYVKANAVRNLQDQAIRIPVGRDEQSDDSNIAEVVNLNLTGNLGALQINSVDSMNRGALHYAFSGLISPIFQNKKAKIPDYLPKIQIQNGIMAAYGANLVNNGNMPVLDVKASGQIRKIVTPIEAIFFTGLYLNVDHPYLKAQIKNQGNDFTPYELKPEYFTDMKSLSIVKNCIAGDLNAYVGNRPEVTTQMGWLRVERACFKGKQLSDVAYKKTNVKNEQLAVLVLNQ